MNGIGHGGQTEEDEIAFPELLPALLAATDNQTSLAQARNGSRLVRLINMGLILCHEMWSNSSQILIKSNQY